MSDSLHALQRAARAFVREHAAGQYARCLSIRDQDGKTLFTIPIPACDETPPNPVPALGSPVAADDVCGWGFPDRGGVTFEGRAVGVKGQKLKLLRLLVEASGPMTWKELSVAWGKGGASEDNVRWTCGDLRKTLQAEFPDFPGDPLPADGEGYRLAVR